jgi:uncharacterized membrane protein YeiB
VGTEQTPGPTPAAERIRSLDALRGIAVLGILIMNIQSFSMIRAAYVNPYAYGDMTGANGLAWLIGHVVADRKFMTIFSLLFGAGVVMMTSRREAAGQSACRLPRGVGRAAVAARVERALHADPAPADRNSVARGGADAAAVFYGHGLGLYGRVDRVGQMGIVFAVWGMLLIGCPLWLRRFRFGPVEWLWRSLSYMKLQPIR